MKRIHFCLVAVLAVSLIVVFGCGSGKKPTAKKDYGKPTWLKPDTSKFAKLSDYETNLEGGTVTVFDPEGWERMPPGGTPREGFKSVIVFKNSGSTIMMTKSRNSKEMPDLDEENIEDFAESAQQLFKAPVRMLKLGNIVGVLFSKPVADKNRLSKRYERRIVATCINGQLFTYELISDEKISSELLGTLYAVISKTRIEGADPPTEDTVAAAPKDDSETSSEPAEPVVVAAASPQSEPKPETTETEVAKPAEPKPDPRPTAAKPTETKPARDKKNTQAILDELDALFN